MNNDVANDLLSLFEKDNIESSNNSSIAPSQTRSDIRVREDSIAYYCEKCKISTFKSTEKKCWKCGYNFGYSTR